MVNETQHQRFEVFTVSRLNMIVPKLVPLFALLLASTSAAGAQQEALKGTKTQEPNPTITASIKSIFSSLSGHHSAADANSESACCYASCALGLCNDFYTPGPTAPPDAAHTITAAPSTITKEACCTARCDDGFCHDEKHFWPHGPFPMNDGCGDRDCPTLTSGQAWKTWWPSGCKARFCGAPTGKKLGTMTSIYPTNATEAHHGAKPTGESTVDPAEAFHTFEMAGQDQDTIPIILENNSGEPVTLLADIDLALTENYISSGMLHALGISSTSSRQLVSIAKPDQRVAAIGNQAFKVTPNAKITFDILTGPSSALKQFANVEFNVFDVATPPKGGSMPWEPELFLGVKFLRDADALRLSEDFAGNAALEGLPVLVRSMEGFKFPSLDDKHADRVKDEL